MDDEIDNFEDDDVSILDLKRKRKEEDSEHDERKEEEKMKEAQRLKAAMHFHTVKLVEAESNNLGIKVDRQTVAALAETAYNFTEALANDLWFFALHAKRHTVQPEDVRLCARKSESLHKLISSRMELLANDAEERKNQRKVKKKDVNQDEQPKKKTGRPKKIKVNDDEDEDDKPPVKQIDSAKKPHKPNLIAHKPNAIQDDDFVVANSTDEDM